MVHSNLRLEKLFLLSQRLRLCTVVPCQLLHGLHGPFPLCLDILHQRAILNLPVLLFSSQLFRSVLSLLFSRKREGSILILLACPCLFSLLIGQNPAVRPYVDQQRAQPEQN
jgi:hypothetical protein